MFRKIIDGAAIVAALGVIALLLQGSGGGKLGATWGGGVSHTNSKFDAVGGFSVNGTDVITSSTALVGTTASLSSITVSGTSTLGAVNGTAGAITGLRCVNQNYDAPLLGAGVNTTTVDTALALAGPSSTFVGFASINAATSSSPLVLTNVFSSGTATSAVASVEVYVAGSSTLAAGINLPSAVLTTCVIQK